jgi:excisionase family DNA binding protein
MIDGYIGVEEAARLLKVHAETVRRLIRKKALPATKVGNKWIIEKDRLQVFAGRYDGRRGRVRMLV